MEKIFTALKFLDLNLSDSVINNVLVPFLDAFISNETFIKKAQELNFIDLMVILYSMTSIS
jgi:hypothetical protein